MDIVIVTAKVSKKNIKTIMIVEKMPLLFFPILYCKYMKYIPQSTQAIDIGAVKIAISILVSYELTMHKMKLVILAISTVNDNIKNATGYVVDVFTQRLIKQLLPLTLVVAFGNKDLHPV